MNLLSYRIAGSRKNMPGRDHCILALLLWLPQTFSVWLLDYWLPARWILAPFKKCLSGLKRASTNRTIFGVIDTSVVYCGQWACPKKPNRSQTEFDVTDDINIYECFPLGCKDEILTVLKSAEILALPAVERSSYLILPDSQDSSPPNISSFLLVAARILNVKGQDFQSTGLCSMLCWFWLE